MKNLYPVIIRNSFDPEVSVFLCDSEQSAKDLLKQMYEEEVQFQTNGNEWDDCPHGITEDGKKAIVGDYYEAFTEFVIGTVCEHQKDKE